MPKVSWGESNEFEVNTHDALVQRLAQAEEELEPTIVVLQRDDGASLSIGVGSQLAVLDYVPASFDPPYLAARYDRVLTDESLWFLFSGHESEFEPWKALPIEDARRALFEFFDSGALTGRLNWVEI